MTRALIVQAHPLRHGLCHALAETATEAARAQGWEVTVKDLCAEGFDPRLTAAERASYYDGFRSEAEAEVALLRQAEVLILVFPTWWAGFPAVLKGWFDRVWVPGAAYDHSPGFGPMIPRLDGLRAVLAVTTQGAPAWVDWLVLRRPLRRSLRWGIVKPCAPGAKLRWLALYQAESLQPDRIAAFQARVRRAIRAIG